MTKHSNLKLLGTLVSYYIYPFSVSMVVQFLGCPIFKECYYMNNDNFAFTNEAKKVNFVDTAKKRVPTRIY